MKKIFLTIFLVCTFLIGLCMAAEIHSHVFSPERWDRYPAMRYNMIEDLEKKHTIIDMTEEEVLELLGEPTYAYTDSNPRYRHYKYYIGPSEPILPLFTFDPDIYFLVFKDGKCLGGSVQPT